MEVFVLGYEEKTNNFWCFIVTTTRFNKEEKTIENLYKKYNSLTVYEANYRAAGADQFRLEFTDLKEFENMLLTDTELLTSIKEMNLRLMRKGGTIYSHFHCYDLANYILTLRTFY
jgi:hypothetical protein